VVTIVTLAKDCMWYNHNNPTIKQSQTTAVQGWKSCLQQTTLNLNHFKMVEDTGLKIITSRSIWMALPPYQISWKSTKRFKVISGGTHAERQTGDLIIILSFLESRLKKSFTSKKTQPFSITNIIWLILFGEVMTVYSENCTKPITTVCGQTAELLIVKAGGSCSYHWV
jgi:hypothetical protein